MAKKVTAIIKLALPAGKATPGQPVGPTLAPYGINLMAFCKDYNARTANRVGEILPAEITVYSDQSFTFVLKTPPTASLITRFAGIGKGSGVPNKDMVGKLTRQQVREIAEIKMPDLNAYDIEMAMRQVEGTARSMGVEIAD